MSVLSPRSEKAVSRLLCIICLMFIPLLSSQAQLTASEAELFDPSERFSLDDIRRAHSETMCHDLILEDVLVEKLIYGGSKPTPSLLDEICQGFNGGATVPGAPWNAPGGSWTTPLADFGPVQAGASIIGTSEFVDDGDPIGLGPELPPMLHCCFFIEF